MREAAKAIRAIAQGCRDAMLLIHFKREGSMEGMMAAEIAVLLQRGVWEYD
jgi:hypothetical protein